MNTKHDKDDALKIGWQLFLEKGYNGLGVDEICKTTGMTKGAFYNAFKSKENFAVEVIRSCEEMTVSYLTEVLNKPKLKAVDRIDSLYQHMFEIQPEKNFRGCMINNFMSEMGTSSNLMSEATDIAFGKLLNTIEPVVKEAQKNGDITSNINSKALTELLHSTFFGTLTRAKSTRGFNTGAKREKG